MQNLLPRTAQITSIKHKALMHKAFVCPQFDYGDILYDQAHNTSFRQKLESLQCNACLAITGAICSSSREKLCQQLGFESLQQRR